MGDGEAVKYKSLILTARDAAAFLGIPMWLLGRLRRNGEGPTYYRYGRKIIRYRVSDLEEYLKARETRGKGAR